MKLSKKDIIHITAIILITILTILIVLNIPNYTKPPSENSLPITPKWLLIFGIVNIILIGIPAYIHKVYTNDYSKIKSIWFFALFGGITAALLGEQGNVVMIIPYIIIMLIFGLLYKKFTWWKVALSSYLVGVIIENVINRSPMQSPTTLWIAFLIYPYFITKLWDNEEKISITEITKNLKYPTIISILLTAIAIYTYSRTQSPPLIFMAITFPFIITIIFRLIIKWFKK